MANGLPCRVERIRRPSEMQLYRKEAYPIFRALAEEPNRRTDNGKVHR